MATDKDLHVRIEVTNNLMSATTADGLRQGLAREASDIWVIADDRWHKVASVEPDLDNGMVILNCWTKRTWPRRATHQRVRAAPDSPAFYN